VVYARAVLHPLAPPTYFVHASKLAPVRVVYVKAPAARFKLSKLALQ